MEEARRSGERDSGVVNADRYVARVRRARGDVVVDGRIPDLEISRRRIAGWALVNAGSALLGHVAESHRDRAAVSLRAGWRNTYVIAGRSVGSTLVLEDHDGLQRADDVSDLFRIPTLIYSRAKGNVLYGE